MAAMAHTLKCALTLATALVCVPSAATAAEQTTVATLSTPTHVRGGITSTTFPRIAAQDGRVVWSTFDAVSGKWRLMQAVDGRVAAVPIAPRRAPFDVDLGRGPDASPVAAYSRCRRYGRADGPVPTGARRSSGCAVYVYSFEHERERRLAGKSAVDEYWPSVWGSRVAFVRSDPKVGGRAPSLYWTALDGDARSHRLRHPAVPHARGAKVGISEVDMRRGRVAYTWTVTRDRTTRSFVELAGIDGRLSQIGPGASSPRTHTATAWQAVGDPQLTADGVLSRFTSEGAPGFAAHVIWHAVGRDGCVGLMQASDALHGIAMARDGATTYVLDVGPTGPSRPTLQAGGSFPIVAVTGLAHGAVPPRSWRFAGIRRPGAALGPSGSPRATIALYRPHMRSGTRRCFFSAHAP